MTEPLFVSVADAASAFGVSDDLVYDLIATGELPSAAFGRRRMIPRRAIDLVIDRALDGFDPDVLLVRLGAAVDPPIGAVVVADGGSSTTAGPTAPTPSADEATPLRGAPAVVLAR